MTRSTRLLTLWALCVGTMVHASAMATRTAIIAESSDIENTHSKFVSLLRGRGHDVEIHTTEPPLTTYGKRTFDNLILFAPQKKLSSIGVPELLHFVEQGGNILLSSSWRLTKLQRQFARECGVEFEKKGTVVMDHVHPVKGLDADSELYDAVVASSSITPLDRVVGPSLAREAKPIAFSGLGMRIEEESILNFHIVHAPSSAYSSSPTKPVSPRATAKSQVAASQDLGLVTALQARNNARIVFSGSLDLFSDAYFQPSYGNEELSDYLSRWVFQERGVLRMKDIRHQRADGSAPAKMLSDVDRPDQPLTLYPDAEVARDSLVYRVKDNLTFSCVLEEFSDGKWHAFKAEDVQLEFVMLDPYVRTALGHDGSGQYHVTFEAPDQYGIFQFRVVYRRHGLSTLESSTQVSLRPFKHNEYERFIPAAYPYYASAFSMMVGVFLLSTFIVFHEDTK